MTRCSSPSCELVRPGPHAAVVVLAGEHDVGTPPLVRPVLDPLSREDRLRVVIDLSGTMFIDAAVLAVRGGAEQAVTGCGGRFGLRPGTAPAVRRVLELTGWLRRSYTLAPGDAGLWGLMAARAAR